MTAWLTNGGPTTITTPIAAEGSFGQQSNSKRSVCGVQKRREVRTGNAVAEGERVLRVVQA